MGATVCVIGAHIRYEFLNDPRSLRVGGVPCDVWWGGAECSLPRIQNQLKSWRRALVAAVFARVHSRLRGEQ